MQSVHITTKVACSSSAHGEVYSIQHYAIQFVRWLFSGYSDFLNQLIDCHDIAELLLQLVLNTITPGSLLDFCVSFFFISTCLSYYIEIYSS